MKKLILGLTILSLATAGVQNANAGDREWATVGKVLTGIAATAIIVSAIDADSHCNVSYSYAPAYCPPRVVCAPAPVVVYRAPVCAAPQVTYVDYRRGHGRGHAYGYWRHGGR